MDATARGGGKAERDDSLVYMHFKKRWILVGGRACSGSLLAAPFGSAIDEHDAVFRFNDGPTEGFETYVGNKTTFRVINNNWTRQWQKKRPHKINDHTEGTLV